MKEAVVRERRAVTECAVEGCSGLAVNCQYCARCVAEIEALDAWATKRDIYLADPAAAVRQSERDERMRRFIVVLLFMMAGEGLLGFAFDLPITWAWLLVNLGWALLIAALAGWFCARRGR